MDSLKEERERGVTIDIAHREFETKKYHCTIIDAPGHRDFVKNMITGASQADAALLLISVKDGVQPQTKEHAFLAKVLGINQIAVNLNKMDAVGYSQDQYKKVKGGSSELFSRVSVTRLTRLSSFQAQAMQETTSQRSQRTLLGTQDRQ